MSYNTFVRLVAIGLGITLCALLFSGYLLMSDAGLIGAEFTEVVMVVESGYDDNGVYCKVQNELFHEVIRDSNFYTEYNDKIGENVTVIFRRAPFLVVILFGIVV